MSRHSALLLVANWESDAGYAWWLMESFWVALAYRYHTCGGVILAYPKITTLPPAVASAPLEPVQHDFGRKGLRQLVADCVFLRRHRIRTVYLTDRATVSLRYPFYRMFGVRTIITHDHTPGVRRRPKGLKRLLKQVAHRSSWIAVDAAIAPTEFVRQRLINVNGMPAVHCYTAPNGLPTPSGDRKPADLHRQFRIPGGRLVIVMAGRAHAYKRVDFAIETMAFLKRQGRKDMHFLFLGDGPDLFRLQNLAEALGVRDRCSLPGSRQYVPNLLEGADVAFHPSSGEVGYSLAILEYMRAGLPVVVPDNPSVCGATTAGITGLIYAADDVAAAGRALAELLDNQGLRIQMGGVARTESQRYLLQGTHEALMRVFEAYAD